MLPAQTLFTTISKTIRPKTLWRFAFACLALVVLSVMADAQPRDHLTDQESELIRYHQQLDKRIDVFIKAIDRRFSIINGVTQAKTKKLDRDEPDWGDLPKGTRAQLLDDIAGILDEAITNLDDVSQHDEKNPLISRSLRKLTTAANGYVTQLNALRTQTKDADELVVIEKALDNAAQIIEAGNKLPAATLEKDKDKKKNKP
jgi:hypothetical protein